MDELNELLKQVNQLLNSKESRWEQDYFLTTTEHAQIMHRLLEEFGPESIRLTKGGWVVDFGYLEELKGHLELQGAKVPREPEPMPVISKAPATTTPETNVKDASPNNTNGVVCHRLVASEEFLGGRGDSDARDKQRENILGKLRMAPNLYLPKASRKHVKQMADLRRDFPNFSEVIQQVEEQLHLLVVEREVVNLEPMLMVGPPGIGKTEFARRLASALRLSFSSEDLASCTGSFVLTGSSSSWAGGQQGAVSKAAMNLRPGYGSLMLLDEIDKAGGDAKYPVAPALLNMLEPSTAERFVDEYLGVPLNIRRVISFVATGNDLSCIDGPLKSRLKVFKVPAPDAMQMKAVVRSLDKSLRQQRPGLNRHFKELTEEAIEVLVVLPPRTLRQSLLGAYAMAAARRERAVMQHHLEIAIRQNVEPQKPAIGFFC